MANDCWLKEVITENKILRTHALGYGYLIP